MRHGFRILVALLIFMCSGAQAHITPADSDLAQSGWVLGLLPDGYYIAENTDGTLILIKEGAVVIARTLLPEKHVLLSCTRGTVTGNTITGTTVTVVGGGDAAYAAIPVSGDTIDVSHYYLAGENQDDHMPDQYDWQSVHTAGDICREITTWVSTPEPAQEVRAPIAQ